MEWQQQLRVWQFQDGIIYCFGYVFVACCFFFDLVFISNVTPEDGLAWANACMVSMAQTLFGVPALMTLLTLPAVLASKLSRWVHNEVMDLCVLDGDVVATSGERSSFRREPRSRWNSRALRRRRLLTRGRSQQQLEEEEEEEADDVDLTDAVVEVDDTDQTWYAGCSQWRCESWPCVPGLPLPEYTEAACGVRPVDRSEVRVAV